MPVDPQKFSGNGARPGRTTQPGVLAEVLEAAGRAARALSGHSARLGRATRLGLLLPIPVAPRVAARAVEQSALANDPHPLSYQHFSGLAIDRRHPEDVPFGGQAIVTAGSCA